MLIVGILVAGIAANTAVARPLQYEIERRVDSDHGKHKHKDKHKNKHKNKCDKHDASKGKELRHALKKLDK